MNRFYKLLTIGVVLFVVHTSFAMKGSLTKQSLSQKKAITKKVKLKRSKRSDVRTLAALKRKEEINHPHPEIALDFALRLAMGTLHYRIEAVNLEVALEPLTDEEFNRELMRAFLNYLGVKYENLNLKTSFKAVK